MISDSDQEASASPQPFGVERYTFATAWQRPILLFVLIVLMWASRPWPMVCVVLMWAAMLGGAGVIAQWVFSDSEFWQWWSTFVTAACGTAIVMVKIHCSDTADCAVHAYFAACVGCLIGQAAVKAVERSERARHVQKRWLPYPSEPLTWTGEDFFAVCATSLFAVLGGWALSRGWSWLMQ